MNNITKSITILQNVRDVLVAQHRSTEPFGDLPEELEQLQEVIAMLLPPAHESAVPPHLVMNHTKVLHIAKRLQRAESLLNRVYDGVHKQHWAAGESEAEVCQAIRDFLDDHPQKAARIVPPN